MTPLDRWVLLALLLVASSARPDRHACVPLCRARNVVPVSAGACGQRQNDVLQSNGGRFPIQRLLRLCLNPCGGTDGRSFDDTQTCRSFRKLLIERHRCSCETGNDDGAGKLEEARRRFQRYQHRRSKPTDTLTREEDLEDEVPPDVEDNRNGQDLSESKMKIPGTEDEDRLIGNEQETGGTANMNVDSTKDATDEVPIDWELWCMAQCDNGLGGSACNCDIIP